MSDLAARDLAANTATAAGITWRAHLRHCGYCKESNHLYRVYRCTTGKRLIAELRQAWAAVDALPPA